MLIAPHIGGEAFCPRAAADKSIIQDEDALALCAAHGENASAPLRHFLDAIGPQRSANGAYELGYLLNIPLLGMFVPHAGGWQVDPARIHALTSLLRDVDRPAVVYLSANHFTDSNPAMADALGADARNLMARRDGPMKPGAYFFVDLHAWSLSAMDAPITRLREQVIAAVLGDICALPRAARARVRAVSVLGEVHQLFAGFPDHSGYDAGFDVTDYGPSSLQGFRDFLRARFGTISALNAAIGADFADFAAVMPPARDIHHEALRRFVEHRDAQAGGVLTVQGWAATRDGSALAAIGRIDGVGFAQVPVYLNRTDVTEARHDLPSPNVGFSLKLDFSAMAPGVHMLDVLVGPPGGPYYPLARRHVTVGDRTQSPSPIAPVPPAPIMPQGGMPPSLSGYVDWPPDYVSVFYNPLEPLWQAWREAEVRGYITHFARMVNASCLGPGLAFSHQITPQLDSSWNPDLFAVAASQRPSPDYLPGSTLYGGAAFGDAFFDMQRSLGWHEYGVSEMHPTFAMSQEAMRAMLERHRLAGARFVAPYYMSMKPARIVPTPNDLTRRRIAPDNHDLGSAEFYAAIHGVMTGR